MDGNHFYPVGDLIFIRAADPNEIKTGTMQVVVVANVSVVPRVGVEPARPSRTTDFKSRDWAITQSYETI